MARRVCSSSCTFLRIMKSFIALALLLSAPVFGAPAEARALAQSHHGCGLGRFALMPHHIGREYEAWAWAQVKAAGSQADGCNNCALEPVHTRAPREACARSSPCTRAATLTRAHAPSALTLTVRCCACAVVAGPHVGMSPVWAAPGDICAMQDHMPGSKTHFQQCSESGFADEYGLEAHVKLCLEKGQVDWLWNHGRNGEETEHGHCQTKEGDPHLGPEGLLVCTPSGIRWGRDDARTLATNQVQKAPEPELTTRKPR